MTLHRSDLEDDIALYLAERVPQFQPKLLVDVGAYHGWFAYQFLRAYPNCDVICIEPVTSSAQGLVDNLGRFPELRSPDRVQVLKLALSDHDFEGEVTTVAGVTTNHLVRSPDEEGTEAVAVRRGNDVITELGVREIDFLKIDAEGEDLRVLGGFHEMLKRGAIVFVQVECAMDPHPLERHEWLCPFDLVHSFMRQYGYRLFRVTNQASNGDTPVLARADVVFVNERSAWDLRS